MTATRASLARALVGSSGFSFASWKPGFYPAGMPQKEFLRHYAERLPTVELNSTFYQLPSEATLRGWADAVPDGFEFAVKMTRNITFGSRLDAVGTFCERVRALGDRLGPVLIRFPDTRPRDDGTLRLLIDSLDPELRYAFDLRDPSWGGETDSMLAAAGMARVGSLEGGAPFRYVRLRETPYDDAELAAWVDRLAGLRRDGLDVYCYFKHEDEPTAPRYARRMIELLCAA